MAKVLLVSEDNSIYRVLKTCFSAHGLVDRTENREAALEMLRHRRYDFVFIDIELLNISGSRYGYKATMQYFWQLFPTIEIIVMSSPDMIREAVKAVKQGASNYLTYPITATEVSYAVESINESKIVQSELDYLRNHFWKQDSRDLIRTNSPVMQEVFEKVRSVAPTISTVLLVGETGTGKELIAKSIHYHGKIDVFD